ncbi:MAG: hypothetical protein ACFFB3_04780 [Candidatus Hodarchaeota archaeon]
MRIERNIILACFVAILISFSQSVHATGLKIKITNGYYDALDDDGIPNDVIIYLQSTAAKGETIANFYLEVILPSQALWSCFFSIESLYHKYMLRIEVHNIATQSGWYTGRIYAVYPIEDGWNLELFKSYEFDAPGIGGSDPTPPILGWRFNPDNGLISKPSGNPVQLFRVFISMSIESI